MRINPRSIFGILICLLAVLQASSGQTVTTANPDTPKDAIYCPSFCDDQAFYNGQYCTRLTGVIFYCCLVERKLECCTNVSLKVGESVSDNYNCYHNQNLAWLAKYWKIVLGVCLPLGVISVVGAVTLCSIQNRRLRRRRQREQEMSERERSNSAVSSYSGSSASSGRTVTEMARAAAAAPPSDTYGELDVFSMHTLQPPPYSPEGEKPPPYTDIFPS